MPGDGAVEEFAEALGEARPSGLEVVADLAVQRSTFADQIATMADQETERKPGFVKGLLEQGRAGECGPMDGEQIGIIGLVAGIDRSTELLGGIGVDDTGLEASLAESSQDVLMEATGAFDGHEAVVDLVAGEGSTDQSRSSVELRLLVFNRGGWDENAAVEIGEHEFGTGLGTIEADDAEVFGSNELDARMEDTTRLGDGVRMGSSGCVRAAHEKNLQGKEGSSHPGI